MGMELCWRQELPLFMGAGKSSTVCPGEDEQGVELASMLLPGSHCPEGYPGRCSRTG